MKKMICITLLFMASLCQSADDVQYLYPFTINQDTWNELLSVAKYINVQSKICKARLYGYDALYLSKQEIETIPKNMPNLEYLWLKGNQIQELPGNFHLPDLVELNLCGNQIQHIKPQALDQFPRLRTLYLTGNYLQDDNIAQLREYKKCRDNLAIIFGEQKPVLNVKPARRSKLEEKKEEE